jgi:hypothetical protein
MDHPSDETLKRFATGTASAEEGRLVVAHLLKGCGLCSRKLKQILEPSTVGVQSYDSALDRFDRGLIESLRDLVSPAAPLAALQPRRLSAQLPDRRGNSSGSISDPRRARRPTESR